MGGVRRTFNLIDYYNPETEIPSTARTTDYTCTAMVNLIARELWNEPGLASPEFVGRNADCFNAVLKHLEDWQVHLFQRVEAI